jgi:hypothetical protein
MELKRSTLEEVAQDLVSAMPGDLVARMNEKPRDPTLARMIVTGFTQRREMEANLDGADPDLLYHVQRLLGVRQLRPRWPLGPVIWTAGGPFLGAIAMFRRMRLAWQLRRQLQEPW